MITYSTVVSRQGRTRIACRALHRRCTRAASSCSLTSINTDYGVAIGSKELGTFIRAGSRVFDSYDCADCHLQVQRHEDAPMLPCRTEGEREDRNQGFRTNSHMILAAW